MPVVERLAAWLAELERGAAGGLPARVRLIHNAALLSAPGNVGDGDAADMARSLRVGLEAPIALTAAFLRATAHWSASDRRVLFISSGLGRRPMAGSAAYCAQKAGLDHFARALASRKAPPRARCARRVGGAGHHRHRHAAPAARADVSFLEQMRFAELHRSGALDSPAQAAAMLAILERPDYGMNPVTDVRVVTRWCRETVARPANQGLPKAAPSGRVSWRRLRCRLRPPRAMR